MIAAQETFIIISSSSSSVENVVLLNIFVETVKHFFRILWQIQSLKIRIYRNIL